MAGSPHFTIAAAYVSARLEAIRGAEIESLRGRIAVLQAGKQEPRPLAGRRISPAQHEEIVAALSNLAGAKVNVVSVPEFEAGSYAHQIIKTLRTAGLGVRVVYFPDTEAIPAGLRSYWSDDSSPGKQIAAAFEHAGIALNPRRGAPSGGAVLEIHIGRSEDALPGGSPRQ